MSVRATNAGVTSASSPRCAPVTVRIGSSTLCTRPSLLACVTGTMNGRAASITYRTTPAAMRLRVFSASGFFRSKMLGHGSDQSMIDAAACHACSRPLPCVGVGHAMRSPSQRATRKNRRRVVGVP